MYGMSLRDWWELGWHLAIIGLALRPVLGLFYRLRALRWGLAICLIFAATYHLVMMTQAKVDAGLW